MPLKGSSKGLTCYWVEDGVTNKEEKLNKQYAAIKINYKNEVISEM